MDRREQFLNTYNNPVRVFEAASMAKEPMAATSPTKSGPTGIGTWFKGDIRNIGGKVMVNSQLHKHKAAIKQAKAHVNLKPPHAHISKVQGHKKDFGHDVKRKRRKGLSQGHTILTRKMKDITPVLHQQECFTEVKETFRRIRDVKRGLTYELGQKVNNRKPETFSLSKKLNENRRNNTHLITEHVKNLASLHRRLSSLNNLDMRKKNVNDPTAFPAKIRRPGAIPQDHRLLSLKRRLDQAQVHSQTRILHLERRIVSKALSSAGQSPKRTATQPAAFFTVQNESEQKQRPISMSFECLTKATDMEYDTQAINSTEEPPAMTSGDREAEQKYNVKAMTRQRTEAGTIESNSQFRNNRNLLHANLNTTSDLMMLQQNKKLQQQFTGFQPLSQPSASSFQTATRNQNRAAYHTVNTVMPQTLNPPESTGAFSCQYSLLHQSLHNDQVLGIGVSGGFGKSSHSRKKRRKEHKSDLEILNRVRIRRNRTLAGAVDSAPMTNVVMTPHALVQPQQFASGSFETNSAATLVQDHMQQRSPPRMVKAEVEEEDEFDQ